MNPTGMVDVMIDQNIPRSRRHYKLVAPQTFSFYQLALRSYKALRPLLLVRKVTLGELGEQPG